MANLLVMMEFHRGALLPLSLEVLGQARRLGSSLGLTVYALVPLPPEPAEAEDITVRCGRFGADKVLLLTGDSLFSEQEMRFQQYADALVAACTMLPPRLLLMGDTPAARDIVPRLAARLGAEHLPAGQLTAVEQRLVLCDADGRHLALPSEAPSSDGVPPLTRSVMATIPAGRYEMAWGTQDAELMIVPPNDESSQTIPNLTLKQIVRGGFLEEAMEPLPLPERVAIKVTSEGGTVAAAPDQAAALPLWHIELIAGRSQDPAAASSSFALPIWRVTIGDGGQPGANYQLKLPESEVAGAAETLRALLALPGPAAAIVNPSPLPPAPKELDGFNSPSEFTPTADDWDFGGDTLNGDEETTSKIRAILGEKRPTSDPAVPASSALVTPEVPTTTTKSKTFIPTQTSIAGSGAAMWEGFATMPGDSEPGAAEQGSFNFDDAHADTSPIAVVAPKSEALKKSEGDA